MRKQALGHCRCTSPVAFGAIDRYKRAAGHTFGYHCCVGMESGMIKREWKHTFDLPLQFTVANS